MSDLECVVNVVAVTADGQQIGQCSVQVHRHHKIVQIQSLNYSVILMYCSLHAGLVGVNIVLHHVNRISKHAVHAMCEIREDRV